MADDRDGLVVLIADLHRLNITTLSLDPEKDGTGGENIQLSDVVAFADSLQIDGEEFLSLVGWLQLHFHSSHYCAV
jgi:hypothetical protein